MFPRKYFAGRYSAPRYWPQGVGVAIVVVGEIVPFTLYIQRTLSETLYAQRTLTTTHYVTRELAFVPER